MTPRLLRAAAPLLALVVTACSSSATPSSLEPGPGGGSAPTTTQLVARAHLDPCPATGTPAGGHSLPDLTLPCLATGPAVRLAGLRGVPTVVNIWATWCGPCQRETRYLSEVYDALKPKVRLLGVDTEDDRRSALDFATHVSPPMRYPQVADDAKKLLVALRLPSAVPTTLFVDASGHLVHASPGPYRSAAALRADISRYLGVAG